MHFMKDSAPQEQSELITGQPMVRRDQSVANVQVSS